MVALQLFVSRTRLGRAMRSTAQDREAAQLMGVDINRTIALTFFIGSALAGAAGVVQGLYFGNIQFTLGFQAGLKAFTAAVLGGIGNITGAALGGFLIGFVEVTAAALGLFVWGQAAGVRGPHHHARLPARPACSASSSESGHERRRRRARRRRRRRPGPARAARATSPGGTARLSVIVGMAIVAVVLPLIVAAAAVQQLQRPERLGRRVHDRRHLRPARARA